MSEAIDRSRGRKRPPRGSNAIQQNSTSVVCSSFVLDFRRWSVSLSRKLEQRVVQAGIAKRASRVTKCLFIFRNRCSKRFQLKAAAMKTAARITANARGA
jgi:hypothetical protein